MKLSQPVIVASTIGILALAATMPVALASPGSGLTVVTLATADLDDTVHANSGDIRLRTKEATVIRVQNLVFAAGAKTGWHHHPGVIVVAVQSGAVTVWNSDCTSTTYGPGLPSGSAFTESGDEDLQVTSSAGASVYATYIVPQVDPPEFRIEGDDRSCE
jgi:hypothetical protein